MARPYIGFSFTGIDKQVKEIKEYKEEVQKKIDNEMQASVITIAENAKAAAPRESGDLIDSIDWNRLGNHSYNVVAEKYYSPYVEFGTGGLVDVPPGLEDYAMQFYIGPGVNLPAHPFLFPAYEAEKKELIKRIRQILNLGGNITVIRPGPSNITSVTTI